GRRVRASPLPRRMWPATARGTRARPRSRPPSRRRAVSPAPARGIDGPTTGGTDVAIADVDSAAEGRPRAPASLAAALAAIEDSAALERAADVLARVTAPLRRPRPAGALRGEWFGHALHPLL